MPQRGYQVFHRLLIRASLIAHTGHWYVESAVDLVNSSRRESASVKASVRFPPFSKPSVATANQEWWAPRYPLTICGEHILDA
jgi:hypothetical protein